MSVPGVSTGIRYNYFQAADRLRLDAVLGEWFARLRTDRGSFRPTGSIESPIVSTR